MNKFVEASNALIARIDNAIALGEYPECANLIVSSDEDIFLDTKTLCHEFGNHAIVEILGKIPNLAQCRKSLEKIRDTALFRTRSDS